jgi:fatty-acyl-CoA synthase
MHAYVQHGGGRAVDEDGWFTTGDVATIDSLGHMEVTDRSKDVIKSGGEWISSIAIENVAMAHPKVRDGPPRSTCLLPASCYAQA